MSTVVDTFRRSHPGARPPRKSRRWLAVGVVLGIVTVAGFGAALLEGVPGMFDLATALASHAPLPARASAPLHGIMDGPVTGLIIVGVGLLTGLMVYLGLGRLLPVNEPDPHPYELVRGRKEITQERRYHGGPIRD